MIDFQEANDAVLWPDALLHSVQQQGGDGGSQEELGDDPFLLSFEIVTTITNHRQVLSLLRMRSFTRYLHLHVIFNL